MTSSLDMIRGRSNIVTLTNNSGGALVAGDVCIQDTSADEKVTTTTSAASLLKTFIAAESIAAGATGKFYSSGYCPLVTPNASVTRGRYLFTHTVAKQAAESATYGAGAFGVIFKSGTTPSAWLFGSTAQGSGGGSVATDTIWDAQGDIAVATGADAASKLTKGAAGTVLTAGASTLAYALPPGYEFDYVQKTSSTSITATTEGTSNTVVTGNAVTYDGSTIIMIEFFAYAVTKGTNATYVMLREGSTTLSYFAAVTVAGAATFKAAVRLTPGAGSHTYLVTAMVDAGTGSVAAGASGSDYPPCYMRITKV